ncbi:hypothetical protein H5410_006747 [Solanum commersonii]|uniref:Uncharacterized protein n=1 Tax=Solanum commersonii TaxID=4109 RepID=A0A9J6AAN0_SOLCO|nr:hypothetical protein H5410_006747 [Solanum commersonii]
MSLEYITLLLICPLDYKNYKVEIKPTFFLAPQDNGYFVLNDVNRYVEENDTDIVSEMINRTEDICSCFLLESFTIFILNPKPTHVVDTPNLDQVGSHVEEVQHVGQRLFGRWETRW